MTELDWRHPLYTRWRTMTAFEKLALRGLWIIMKQVLRNGKYMPGTDEFMWAKDVCEATGDDDLSAENLDKMSRP